MIATKINIIDPDPYTSGVPHAEFKRPRDEEPVNWRDEEDGPGFWSVTRYADLLERSRQPQIFSSAQGIRLEGMGEEERKAGTH